MGLFAVFGVESSDRPVDSDEVATATGWLAFMDWAISLPADYSELNYLGEYAEVFTAEGEQQDALEALETDLKRALHEKPNRPSRDVLRVAKRLLSIVRNRPKDAFYLMVTDGTGGDGDEDDEE